MTCNCWSGCVPPGSSTSTPRPGDRARWARHRATAPSSPLRPCPAARPDFERTAESGLYGSVTVRAWAGLHQKLGSTGRWASWPRDKQLPIVRGTVLQVVVGHLPDGRKPPKDLWLRHAGPVPADPDLLWKAYLRRFDQEHFHRFAKSYLGLASAHLSSAAATDRWVALAMGPTPSYASPATSSTTSAAPGTHGPTRQAAQSLQGPSRLPPTPRTNRHTRRLAQTRPPRPRPPERLEEPPEIQATALPQERTDPQQTRRVTTKSLNRKLSGLARKFVGGCVHAARAWAGFVVASMRRSSPRGQCGELPAERPAMAL